VARAVLRGVEQHVLDGLLDPQPIAAPTEGLAVNAFAAAINAAWSFVLIRRGRTMRSPALVADGWHLKSDVVTSAAVIVGVALAVLTGWAILDPALAVLVAINILWTGWKVIRGSIGGLMDEAVPDATLKRIREVISKHAAGALEAHDVRTRHAGRATFVDFHLVVPGQMSVSDAHDICDRIEDALTADDPDTVVTIHVEPEAKAKHSGVVVL
jgi:cation diffusion facilitator family transporter